MKPLPTGVSDFVESMPYDQRKMWDEAGDETRAFVVRMESAPADKSREVGKMLLSKGQNMLASVIARKRLYAHGQVDWGDGSYYRWMEREWAEKLWNLGLLIYEPPRPPLDFRGNPVKGKYIPRVERGENERIVTDALEQFNHEYTLFRKEKLRLKEIEELFKS